MELEELRGELAGIDRQIIELASRRRALAVEIGRVKQTAGRATRDFAQEKDVIERARRVARDAGLPAEVAASLMGTLIHDSLTAQEQERVSAQGSGSGKRVLLIGGAGQMGRWFARFLASQDYAVEIADPSGPVEGHPHRADWRDGPLDHDLIIVATPLRDIEPILLQLAGLHPPGIVLDLGSLKSPVRAGLAALIAAGVRATSVHPMFGPDTEMLSGRHVIFVDLGHPEATRAAHQLFASTMATQVEMDLESHDRLIAYVLGLSHALNIAFFTALAESGETATRLAGLSSTTFDAQLDVAARVARENPHLYYDIQHLNDYGTEGITALLYAVERLRSVVRAADEDGFVNLMDCGRDYMARVSAVRPDRGR